jgi:6-phosphogluconolactonase
MVWEALLSRAPIPARNIHAVPVANTTPECAARTYEQILKSFYGSENLDSSRPLFAINLLGLGEDGHLASLLPGTDALHESKRWVTSVSAKQPEQRITLTYPALESSRHAAFLVAGEEKAAILARLRAHDLTLPASHFEPVGSLRIFADVAAASELS